MRILPLDEHQARKEKILQAVVHLYINTGKPVGSSTLVDNYRINLSPASIRNVLAELEEEGFLTHPHTSAGRVPTDKGYRFYVDSIVHIQKLAVEEEKRIREEYLKKRREIEDFMLSTTRVLSALSNCTGFVVPPNASIEHVRRVELIPIGLRQILGVLVSETGMVRHQIIEVEHMPEEEVLRKASRHLNEHLHGFSISEAHNQLLKELDLFRREQLAHAELFKSLAEHFFDTGNQGEFYVEGASNMLKFPEFQDYESMRHFAQLVDEKEQLGKVLMRGLNKEGLQIRIGSEAFPELKDFSVVASGYKMQGRPVGVLGILGPKRMEYGRMIAIVNTVAELMNRFLESSKDKLIKDSNENDGNS